MVSLAKDPCPICHEMMSNTSTLLPCGHWFHKACFNFWYSRIIEIECPLCRRHVPRPAQAEATAPDTVRLAWWNLADPSDEEARPGRYWRHGSSVKDVCDEILVHNPTVFSLFEIRVCEGDGEFRGSDRLASAPTSILTYIAQRTGLAVADLRPCNLGETSWQAVLYDAQRVHHIGSRAEWVVRPEWVVQPLGSSRKAVLYSHADQPELKDLVERHGLFGPTVEERGVLVVVSEFQLADGKQRRFKVASAYLPQADKLAASRSLAEWARRQRVPVPCFLGCSSPSPNEGRLLDDVKVEPASTYMAHSEKLKAARSLAYWAWRQQPPPVAAPSTVTICRGRLPVITEGTQVTDTLCAGPGAVWTPVSTEATPTFSELGWLPEKFQTLDHAVALNVPGWTKAAASRAVGHTATRAHYVLEITVRITGEC